MKYNSNRMELVSKEFDLQIYLGSFNGNLIRFFADTQSDQIYIHSEDFSLIMAGQPDGMTRRDFDSLKQSLNKTLHKSKFQKL